MLKGALSLGKLVAPFSTKKCEDISYLDTFAYKHNLLYSYLMDVSWDALLRDSYARESLHGNWMQAFYGH